VLEAVDMDQRFAGHAVRGVLAIVDAGIERRERALEIVVRTIGQVAALLLKTILAFVDPFDSAIEAVEPTA
jgi:hypothetical protein